MRSSLDPIQRFTSRGIGLKLVEHAWADLLSDITWREAAAIVILMMLLLGFVMRGWEEILVNWNSVETDQSAYLRLGLQIRRAAALTDGNRHPLYPAMLALLARPEWSYFTGAKLFNLAIGTLTLAAVYWIARRVSNIHAALLSVVLLSQAHRFLDSAAKVVVEPLLTLIVVAVWFLLWESKGSANWAGLAGLGAGLAYLAKGTGQIILIAFLASWVLTYGGRVLRKRTVRLFVVGYVVFAAVLWLYNILEYGNPFYSFSTTHAMWLDTWEDRYVVDPSQLPTMVMYLRTHSVQEIVRRLGNGLISVVKPIQQTWVPLWDVVLPLAQVVILAILVLRGTAMSEEERSQDQITPWQRAVACLRARREGAVFTVVLLGMWYVLFAWYFPVSDSPRFFLPVAPIAHCCIASALVLGVRMVLIELRWPSGKVRAALINLGYLALAAFMVLTTSSRVLAGLEAERFRDPFLSDVEQNADAEVVLQWLLSQESDRPMRVLSGPSHTLPFWRHEGSFVPEDIPVDLLRWDELTALVRQRGLPWAVVDTQMVERRPDVLGGYFALQGDDLILKESPPGWTLVHQVDGRAYDWYVFRTSQQ